MQALLKRYKEYKHRIASINWDLSWEEEYLYLKELKENRNKMPQSGIYDSICQFRAQMYKIEKRKFFLLQAVSLVAFAVILLRGLTKSVKKSTKADAIYFYKTDIFPSEIINSKTLVLVTSSDVKLTRSDIAFLWKIFLTSPFNWILLSSTAFRISNIRFAITKHNISEVLANIEYSCACGAIFEYCSYNNLILKNFMHGEKLLSIRDSFTRFHEFYVWNNHYKKIFETLCTNSSSIIIFNPWDSKNKKTKPIETKKVCYFMGGEETKDEIKIVNKNLSVFTDLGYQVYYKKHPRPLDDHSLNNSYTEYLQFSKIEDLYIFDYIISPYGSILFQCYINNQGIIVDDITNPQKVKQLQDRNYIFLNKINNVPLLSSFKM